jgi:hypothetical protein
MTLPIIRIESFHFCKSGMALRKVGEYFPEASDSLTGVNLRVGKEIAVIAGSNTNILKPVRGDYKKGRQGK